MPDLNNDLLCPVTQQYFCEPVKTQCGHLIEKEKIAIETACPMCRRPNPSYKDDTETAEAVAEFLGKNLNHLPHQYSPKQKIYEILKYLQKAETYPDALELFRSNLQLLFFSEVDLGTGIHLLCDIPSELLFKFINELNTSHKIVLDLALKFKDPLGITTLDYIISKGEQDKFTFIFNLLNNDVTELCRSKYILHSAAQGKNPALFKLVVKYITNQNPKFFITTKNKDGQNLVAFAVKHSTCEVVEAILDLLKTSSASEIMPIIMSEDHPDIFALAASHESSIDGFEITKKLNNFLKEIFPNDELKQFKKFCEKKFLLKQINKTEQQAAPPAPPLIISLTALQNTAPSPLSSFFGGQSSTTRSMLASSLLASILARSTPGSRYEDTPSDNDPSDDLPPPDGNSCRQQ